MMPFGDIGSAVLAALGAPAAISVTRRAAGAYGTDGVFVPGASSVLPMTAHVQPAPSKDVQQLPENERSKEAIAVYTRDALVASDVASAVPSDEVSWAGRSYKVVRVDDWTAQARYARAICTRMGV